MLNLLFMPLGAGSLLALSVSGGGVPFWIATALFWTYCVANHQVENMGEHAPNATAAVQLATLGGTVLLGAYGAFRIFAT